MTTRKADPVVDSPARPGIFTTEFYGALAFVGICGQIAMNAQTSEPIRITALIVGGLCVAAYTVSRSLTKRRQESTP